MWKHIGSHLVVHLIVFFHCFRRNLWNNQSPYKLFASILTHLSNMHSKDRNTIISTISHQGIGEFCLVTKINIEIVYFCYFPVVCNDCHNCICNLCYLLLFTGKLTLQKCISQDSSSYSFQFMLVVSMPAKGKRKPNDSSRGSNKAINLLKPLGSTVLLDSLSGWDFLYCSPNKHKPCMVFIV